MRMHQVHIYGGSLHGDWMCSLAEGDWWVWKDCFSLPSCPHKRLKMRKMFSVKLNSEFKWRLWIIFRTCKKDIPLFSSANLPAEICTRWTHLQIWQPYLCIWQASSHNWENYYYFVSSYCWLILGPATNIPPSWSAPSVLLSLAQLMYLGYSEATLKWIWSSTQKRDY